MTAERAQHILNAASLSGGSGRLYSRDEAAQLLDVCRTLTRTEPVRTDSVRTARPRTATIHHLSPSRDDAPEPQRPNGHPLPTRQ